jgi:hypothetical protein
LRSVFLAFGQGKKNERWRSAKIVKFTLQHVEFRC